MKLNETKLKAFLLFLKQKGVRVSGKNIHVEDTDKVPALWSEFKVVKPAKEDLSTSMESKTFNKINSTVNKMILLIDDCYEAIDKYRAQPQEAQDNDFWLQLEEWDKDYLILAHNRIALLKKKLGGR